MAEQPRAAKRPRSALLLPPPDLASGTFAPTSLAGNSGSGRDRRHAQGNWPAFVKIVLPGPRFQLAAGITDGGVEGSAIAGHHGGNSDDGSDGSDEDDLNEEAATLIGLAGSAVAKFRTDVGGGGPFGQGTGDIH